MHSKIIINNYFQHLHPIIHFYWLDFSEKLCFTCIFQKNSNGKIGAWDECPSDRRRKQRRKKKELRSWKSFVATFFTNQAPRTSHISKKAKIKLCICVSNCEILSSLAVFFLHIFFHLRTNIQSLNYRLKASRILRKCLQQMFHFCVLLSALLLTRIVKTLKLISQKKTLYSILLQYFMSLSWVIRGGSVFLFLFKKFACVKIFLKIKADFISSSHNDLLESDEIAVPGIIVVWWVGRDD